MQIVYIQYKLIYIQYTIYLIYSVYNAYYRPISLTP